MYHARLVSILSRPLERLQLGDASLYPSGCYVSILSRPLERLQLADPGTKHGRDEVSILSRPLERLQHWAASEERSWFLGFNPQPPSRAAATIGYRHLIAKAGFNPQPPSRAAATSSALRQPMHGGWFQSSAALSSGCNYALYDVSAQNVCFNPQPPSRAAATLHTGWTPRSKNVSILSRPLERLQQGRARGCEARGHVSILSRPLERLQRGSRIS